MGHHGVRHSHLGAVGGLLGLVNLHAIIGLAFTLFLVLLLSFAATALALEILASLIIIFLGWGHAFNASHSLILAFSSAISLTRTLGGFLLLVFILNLLGAILLSIGYQIGLWLLRREFSRCRFLRVPEKPVSLLFECVATCIQTI